MAIMPKSASPAPAAEVPALSPAKDTAPVSPKRDSSVKGQVAMHAIITGYKVAANLAATLGSTPDKIREELHRLAAEVAAKVEDYTFHE